MARILLWSNAFFPLIGGVEVLGEKLTRRLAQRGHEIAVVTDRPIGVEEHSNHHGVHIHRLEMIMAMTSGNIEQWLAIRARVARIKREFRPELVWNYLLQADSMFHLMTEAAFPAPTLVTVHGAVHPEGMGEGSAMRKTLESAKHITACSKHALVETLRYIPAARERASVIWNGLDMPALEPVSLCMDPPILLCIGRMNSKEEKGFDIAIDAMARIVDRFPDARLWIAGDGSARRELENHAALSPVAHSIEFRGWIHPERVEHLMNEVSVVLMPSRVPEGFGLVALQGQQMARPVVASDVGGVSEVVLHGETGLLVPNEDGDALAAAVVDMLGNPENARRMGLAGRSRAERDFGLTRHVDAYDSLLTQLTSIESEYVC